MMQGSSPCSRWFFVFALAFLALVVPAQAGDIGQPSGGGFEIEWKVKITGHERIQLTVLGPDDEIYQSEFVGGRNPSFRISDLGDDVQDGQYSYEMRVVPKVSAQVKAQLKNARANGDEKAARMIRRAAGLDVPLVQSGSFTIANGLIVAPDAVEPSRGAGAASAKEAPASTEEAGSTANGTTRPGVTGSITPLDQVIADDLIVQQSLCVGFDCVNGESFGFDTIRLKENNTRIGFSDTSVGSFPSNDWELTANDSASGGANRFSIMDVTGAKVPLTVTAGAPTNSLFVSSNGKLGARTATPVLDLHFATTDTPAARLEQTNAGGFTAQTWDIAGNEANFFIRDVTGGSKLPFRIRPGAPTSSIDIAASGNVGIGIASPAYKLHVSESVDNPTLASVENTTAGATAVAGFRVASDVAFLNLWSHSGSRTATRWGASLGGWNELVAPLGNGLAVGTKNASPLVLGTNGAKRLEIGANGGVTVNGDFTATGTKNFAVPDPADSTKAIYFAALEGPEAGTYYRGSAKTVNGEAVIELPDYFSSITESQRMTVQLTPVGAWGQLFVAAKSPDRLVIKTAPGSDDLEFDFMVYGVRLGYLEYEVVRTNELPQ